ncbi:hypothetical protein BH11MYX1_BH11MYX1_14560 [soil metagenome]
MNLVAAGMLVASTASASPATVFAPGVISGPAHEASPAFTPDGKTVYFSRQNANVQIILESHRTTTGWSEPAIASFSGTWNDLEPAMAPDGTYLVFVSNRPSKPDGQVIDGNYGGKRQIGAGGNLWRVDRTVKGWGPAIRLSESINSSPSTFAPAIAKDGSLYFMQPGPKDKFVLYRAAKTASGFDAPVALAFSDPAYSHVDPAVAADDSFMVFASTRPPALDMDLFLVKRTTSGWGTPLHLAALSAPGSDAELRLSPDGKTLYFSSERIEDSHSPRSASEAKAALAAFAWNNSLYNIWQADLTPYLR